MEAEEAAIAAAPVPDWFVQSWGDYDQQHDPGRAAGSSTDPIHLVPGQAFVDQATINGQNPVGEHEPIDLASEPEEAGEEEEDAAEEEEEDPAAAARERRLARRREESRSWRARNPDKVKAYAAKYKAENPQTVAAAQANYRDTHRAEINAKGREAWAAGRGEKRNEQRREQRKK